MHKTGLDRKDLNRLTQSFRRIGVKYPYAFAKDVYYFLQVSNKNHTSIDKWTDYFTIDRDSLVFNLELLIDKKWFESFDTSGITTGYKWTKFLKSLDNTPPDLIKYKLNFIKEMIGVLNAEEEKLMRYL